MESLRECQVCGNGFPASRSSCPFCGAAREKREGGRQDRELHALVNLEANLPTVNKALERLRIELAMNRGKGVRVLTLIHGYGSSGQGGQIRLEVRRQLEYLKARGEINEVIIGEEFHRSYGRGKQLLRRFPALARHHDLNRANPGITLVVL